MSNSSGNNRSSRLRLYSSLAVGIATVLVLSIVTNTFWTSASINTAELSESNSVNLPEVFDVVPVVEIVETIEVNVDTRSSTVTPVTSNIESSPEVAEFLLPFLQEAYAVNASQTSLTNKEWQSLPSSSNSIAYDAANDDIWFNGFGTAKIHRLDLTTGTITSWPIITGTDNTAVALDPSGRVYFAMGSQDKIGRLDPATNSIIEWFLPGIPYGSDYIPQVSYDSVSGHVIYNRVNTASTHYDQRIGKLNPTTNQVTEWNSLCNNNNAWCIERFGLDPINGDIYFGEESTNTMKRIRPSTPTTLTSWAIPQPSSNPIGVTVDSSQTVYAALNGGNRILKLVTTGPSVNQITQWLVPTTGFQPFWVVRSSTDEAVYFTEYNAGKIGRLVPSSNLFTEWTLSGGVRPTQVITDASGNLYWSVDNAGRIGRLS